MTNLNHNIKTTLRLYQVYYGIYAREIQATPPALLYDYTSFADGVLHLKKSFKRSSFNILNVVFYYAILNKTNFLYYEKKRLYC
jgi:hypothetical protein